LSKEAVKLKLTPDNLRNISCLNGWDKEEMQKIYDVCGEFYFEEHTNKLWICGGSFFDVCVFNNGKFATIIQPKKMTIQEIEKEFNIQVV